MHSIPVRSGLARPTPVRSGRLRSTSRWLAVGAAVVAFGGASVAAASAPPTDAPAGSAADSTGDSMAAGLPGTCASMPTGTMTADTMTADTMPAGTMTADTMTGTEAAAGTMAADTAAATDGPFVQTAESEYGTILVDAECRTLYAFTPDTEGEPTCVEGCATAWPPLLVADGVVPALAEGLDASLFSIVEHPESGPMLKVGDWPLYYFANDAAPGDVNGQGLNDVWWVVAPDGSLIETAPAGTEAGGGSAPAATEPMGSEPSGTDGY